MRFRNSSSPDHDLDINIAPLVDVVFLLLIFFAVTTTFSKESVIKMNMAQATGEMQKGDNELEIHISAEGAYAVKAPVDRAAKALVNTSVETLSRALKQAAGTRTDLHVAIRADRKTPHEAILAAMDAAGRLGLSKIAFVVEHKEQGR